MYRRASVGSSLFARVSGLRNEMVSAGVEVNMVPKWPPTACTRRLVELSGER
jgi:hypothetical protein